jgi:hypothetical protein
MAPLSKENCPSQASAACERGGAPANPAALGELCLLASPSARTLTPARCAGLAVGHHVHDLTTRLAKTHGEIVVECLNALAGAAPQRQSPWRTM